MGIMDVLHPQPTTPSVPSVLPNAAQMQIMGGQLPVLQMTNLFLQKGESCHFADQAIYEKRTVTNRRVRRHTGYSAPGLIKGTRVYYGNGDATNVEETKYSSIKGVLYITNKRIIFVSNTEGFDKKINGLVAATPYANCIELRFAKETLKLFVPDGNIVQRVLHMINVNSR